MAIKFVSSTNNSFDVFLLQSPALLILSVILGLISLGIIFRIFHGRSCIPNKSISVFFFIILVYIFSVLVYIVNPFSLSDYLSPLPFALFRDDLLIFQPFSGTTFSALSEHLLSLLIVSFIANLLNQLLPHTNSLVLWLFKCGFMLVLTLFLNLALIFSLNYIFPEALIQYASVIVIAVLVANLLIVFFNPLICLIFSIANPLLGIIYTFFFSSFVGKIIIQSVLTSVLMCALLFLLEICGYSVWSLQASALPCWSVAFFVSLLLYCFFDIKLVS